MLTYREAPIHDAEAIARTEVANKTASLVGVIEFMAPEYELDYNRLLEQCKGYIEKKRKPKNSKDPRVICAASDDELMVGYAACHHTTNWRVASELHSLYVLKDYQGQGIGTHLFEMVVDWVRACVVYCMGVNLYSENRNRRLLLFSTLTPYGECKSLLLFHDRWQFLSCTQHARDIPCGRGILPRYSAFTINKLPKRLCNENPVSARNRSCVGARCASHIQSKN